MEKREIQDKAKPSRSFDWGAIRRRLESIERAAEQGWAPSAEAATKVFRERARALAQEPARAEALEETLKAVAFLLAQETYAVESRYVREVYPLKELTPLPGAPPFLLGIASVHGQILPVVDLKRLFELPEKGLADLNKLVILREGSAELGILADQMLGMRAIPVREIEPSLPTLVGIRAEFLRGVTQGPIVVLDARKILERILTFQGPNKDT